MPNLDSRGPVIAGFDHDRLAQSKCAAMRAVLAKLRTVAPTRATVLLTGETGSGKGVMARLLHHWSDRRARPFVAVNCGAIPEPLLESELFGHERGAFTGAERRRTGRFELADGGTLFLDEVGTISSATQIKLLQVLQDRRFQRVGGDEELDIDVRIVAATNSDLERMQREGAFRADLFHRLNVFPVAIPPLRERREDLPLLIEDLLERLNRLYGKRIERVDPAVERGFLAYAWPGNLRELENVLERSHILEASSRISPDNIPLEILNAGSSLVPVPLPVDVGRTLAETRADAVATVERRYLIEILRAHGGRIAASAAAAGIGTRQLRKLLARHAVDKAEFRPRGRRRPE